MGKRFSQAGFRRKNAAALSGGVVKHHIAGAQAARLAKQGLQLSEPMMRFPAFAATVVLFLVAGCTTATTQTTPEIAARWDHRPEAARWTAAQYAALGNEGRALIDTVPTDIEAFCQNYAKADDSDRKAFWIGLFSGLAFYESTWRPGAAGAGGRYRGLLQIWPTSARFYGCDLSHPKGLYDGPTNLRCAARIAAQAVARDKVVAGASGNWGGVAADWPPLRDSAKRRDIAEFTRGLPACQS